MVNRVVRVVAGLTVMLVLCSLLANAARAGDGIWTSHGPLGVPITGLAISSQDPKALYACTPYRTWDAQDETWVNVYKSTDGGSTWLSIGSPGSSSVDLAIDPGDPEVIYLATGNGVYKSTNAGQTWHQKMITRTTSIAIAPGDGTIYVAGEWSGPAVSLSGIFRSRDMGNSWEHLTDGVPATGARVRSIVVSSDEPETVYAVSRGELVKSTDGGDSWQSLDSSVAGWGQPLVEAVAVHPNNAQILLFSTQDKRGIYKTTDGGQSWTPEGTGLLSSYITTLTVDPTDPDVIYAAAGLGAGIPGIYRILDSGLTWAPMMEGMSAGPVYSIAVGEDSPQSIYAGTASGIWKYTFGPASRKDYGVTINDGATHTDSPDVTLSLTARPGTTEMMLSNDGSFADASWEPFAAQKDWTLEAYEGIAAPSTVYAKFRTFGDVSGLYHDDIVVVGGGPVGGATTRGRDFAFLAPWTTWPGVLLACASLAWMWLKRIRISQ